MRSLLLLVVLSCPQIASGQDKTDPFEMVHPETGEPGVWVPTWLQRVELKRANDLRACSMQAKLQNQELRERRAAAESLQEAVVDLQVANTSLKEHNTALRVRVEALEQRARRRWVWGWTSTSAALVALSILTGFAAQ